MRVASTLIFVMFALGGCGDNSMNADMVSAADLSVVKRVFVTSLGYNGSLGGTRGADSVCATAVGVAGLRGNWIAWISDSSRNAIDRISDVGPWYRLDGYRVFDNKAQLMQTPQAPIDVDETGAINHAQNVWTGTSVGGTVSDGDGGSVLDCQDWNTSGSNQTPPLPIGRIGSTNFKDGQWTDVGTDTCNQLDRIYCFEQ